MTPRVRGFTLVEALIALLILAIVAALAYRGTAELTSGEAQLADESARWRTLDALFTRLEADLRQALPRPSRRGAAIEAAWAAIPADDAGNTALVFTRAGPEFTLEPGVAGQRIGYRLRAGALEVLYWPQLDNLGDLVPTSYALLDHVTAFRVQAAMADGRWSERWPLRDQDELPRGVRVELTLDDGMRLERVFALR